MSTAAERPEVPVWPGAAHPQPVMGVFRGFSPAETVRLATAAWDLGVRQVEVPIETPEAVASLRATVSAGRDRGLEVGAGTILEAAQLSAAAAAGATYFVSPGLDADLVRDALSRGLPFLPGVATPSELLRARALGLTWVKVFPASVLGADWLKAIRGPFPDARIVATGGMHGRNARAFLDAGADVIGVGTAFLDAEQADVLAELIRENHVGA